MRINVLYLGLIRHTMGKKKEEVEIKDNSTLSDLLNTLRETYSNLKGIFKLEKESRVDPTFIVTVNGTLVDPLKGKEVKLKDKDTVALMTLIGGG
ncbi:MAG: MoaD/ThiS family protein [Candidatus Bathyarchaeia archaeon]